MKQLSFLKSLRTLVSYQRHCGIGHYADSEGMQRGLAALDSMVRQDKGKPVSEQQARPVTPGGVSDRRKVSPARSPGLSELSAQISVCTHCSLHQSRQIATPGKGGEKSSLLIVGDWLSVQSGRTPENNETFGREQDRMLARMIAAIALEPDDVFITNAIKCSVPEAKIPAAEEIAACSSYLKQQIFVLSPRVICAMGTVPARILTGSTISLSQLRGRFHACRLSSGRDVPVMPTYHPTYLLHNPEMKKAAWADLQAIQTALERR